MASTSGPVTVRAEGSLAQITGVQAGDGVVVVRSTRFVPQELALRVTVR